MRASFSIICIFAAAASFALAAPAETPEEAFASADKAAASVDLVAESTDAVAKLNASIKKGNTEDACIKTATETIKSMCDAATAGQKSLATMADGSDCKTEGENKKKEANDELDNAKRLAQENKQNVSKLKQQVAEAELSAAAAEQKVKDKEKDVDNANSAAEEARNKCMCAQHSAASQAAEAEKKENEVRKSTVIRESMLVCVAEQRKTGGVVETSNCQSKMSGKSQCQAEAYSNEGVFSVKEVKMADGFAANSCAKSSACSDTPNFDNGHGHGCTSYAAGGKDSWCAGGKGRPGNEWVLGATYRFPEKNCCVCGKGGALR